MDKIKQYSKDISVIVPCWRGAIKFLPKLLSTIPENEEIEIIIVDNSRIPVSREEIDSERAFKLLHSAPERHAGGSRNEGISSATGKWLIFADADDYFTDDAFDVFYSKLNSEAELIYTKPDGIYEDTGEHSGRGDKYASLVHEYCLGTIDEKLLRLGFATPWCKMVSHSLVERKGLKFDEIRAGNDIYFSLTSGFYASKVEAIDTVTYITTVNRGSLTKLRDYEVIKARLYSKLHCNQFLRQHGLSRFQHSIMFAFAEAKRFGVRKVWEFLKMIVKYRQNPFVGCNRWLLTFFRNKENEKRDNKYIVK